MKSLNIESWVWWREQVQVTGQEVAFLECSSGLRSVSRQQSGGQGFITPYKLVQISIVSEKYHYSLVIQCLSSRWTFKVE